MCGTEMQYCVKSVVSKRDGVVATDINKKTKQHSCKLNA